MTLPTLWQAVTLLAVLAVLILPLIRYRRTREEGEAVGAWMVRMEIIQLNALGARLRGAGWLSPVLYLRVLFAVGRVTYPIWWFGALAMLFGDAVNLSWSWRQISDPRQIFGPAVELVLVVSFFWFLGLFSHGQPRDEGRDWPRLIRHWLAVLAYGWLIVQGMAWFVMDPQVFLLRMMVVGKQLRSQETFEQGMARMRNASDEDIDRWIETHNLPRGFTANYTPRSAPPDVVASLRQRFQGQVLEPQMQVLPGGTYFMGCDVAFEPRMAPGSGTYLTPWQQSIYTVCPGHDLRRRHAEVVAPFALGRTEVTFDQWDACVADGGCPHWPEDGGHGRGNLPVTDVSWDDIGQFIAWLNARTGRHYRLPSEAEWEYAARHGTTTAFGSGACLDPSQANTNGESHGWGYEDCPKGEPPMRPLPVGSLKPSPWGLFDMNGNVAEWVSDCRTQDYDPQCTVAVNSKRRGFRGGSWRGSAEKARSSYRSFARHDARMGHVGFRLALDVTVVQ